MESMKDSKANTVDFMNDISDFSDELVAAVKETIKPEDYEKTATGVRLNTDGNLDRKRKKLFNSYSQKPADTKFKHLEYI